MVSSSYITQLLQLKVMESIISNNTEHQVDVMIDPKHKACWEAKQWFPLRSEIS